MLLSFNDVRLGNPAQPLHSMHNRPCDNSDIRDEGWAGPYPHTDLYLHIRGCVQPIVHPRLATPEGVMQLLNDDINYTTE